MLPLKTTFEDIDKLTNYLRSQVGWVETSKASNAIGSRHVDNRKLEAMKYIGLLDRDGNNIKLSAIGQDYADGDEVTKPKVLQQSIRSIPLYFETIEWLHHSNKGNQTKTQLASYWHDNHSGRLDGASGAALTDAVIFFMRVMEQADLSHFVPAGRGRPETFLEIEREKLAAYLDESPADAPRPAGPSSSGGAVTPAPPPPGQPGVAIPARLSPGVHINLEIHIAADAKPSTVEEIFKNMPKYILDSPESAEE